MNKGLLSILKQRLLPIHDPEGPTGKLSEAEHASIYALFQTLTADEAFPAERVRAYVDACTLNTPGMLDDFRFAVELVDRYAARAPSGKHAPRSKFRELSSADRERVLERILPRYPHPLNERAWRRRTSMLSDNLDIVLSRPGARRLRDTVARQLLAFYYSSPEGWDLVGYREFPGRVRAEWEPCEVRSVQLDGDQLMLELSDGCFEPLKPDALEPDEATELAVLTKSGRQRASFSRSAYLALAEYLDEQEDGWVLTIMGKTYPVLRH